MLIKTSKLVNVMMGIMKIITSVFLIVKQILLTKNYNQEQLVYVKLDISLLTLQIMYAKKFLVLKNVKFVY